jgi:hypothetical protein
MDKWTPARPIIGVNEDGSLQTVDSWSHRLTLTDAELEAIVAADSELSAIGHHRPPDKDECLRISSALRALLERTKR